MKTISRTELQEILGIKRKDTLYRWEMNGYFPPRIGHEINIPVFDLQKIIISLESSAFPYKVTPMGLTILKDILRASQLGK